MSDIGNNGKDLQALGRYIVELIEASVLNGVITSPKRGGMFNAAAERIGISTAELRSLRYGERKNPNPLILQQIANRLSGDYNKMMVLAGYAPTEIDQCEKRLLDVMYPVKYLPIKGYVHAGPLTLCDEVHMENVVANVNDPSDYCLIVKGDSMIELGVQDGDTVFVKKQSIAEHNDIVIAMIDGETTLKKFIRTNGSIILQPMNNKFVPIIINKDQHFQILGVVTGFHRKLK